MSNKNNNVKVEIDYDKLAKAIVSAMDTKEKSSQKKTHWRNVAMKWMNGIIYIFFCVSAIISIPCFWNSKYDGTSNSIILCIIATIVLLAIAFVSFLCQQETQDDNYEVASNLFSVNISFVALIIAIIALKTTTG